MTERASSGWNAQLRLLFVGLVTLGVGCLVLDHWLYRGPLESRQIPFVVLLAGFILVERFVVTIEVGEVAHSISLAEIPIVIGLFFAPPGQLVAARLLGTAAVLLVQQRNSGVKLALNIALNLAEVGFTLVIFHAVLLLGVDEQGIRWLAALTAMVASSVLNGLTIRAGVIAMGAQPDRPRQIVFHSVFAAAATTVVALIAVALAEQSIASLWMVGALALLLLSAYRGYSTLLERYRSLRQLHDFTQILADSPELGSTLRHVLQQATSLLNASRAELCLVGSEEGWSDMRVSLTVAGELVTEHVSDLAEEDLLILAVDEGREPLYVASGSKDPHLTALVSSRGARDLVVCPLLSGGRLVGTIAVFDRLGDVSTFAAADLPVFETLANHVTVTLEKARLIDALEAEAAEKEHQALHDSLTGLGNRTLFEQRAVAALASAQETGSQVAVMVMDLNRFKDVNDTLGHHNGDAVLRQVADRLQPALPLGGTAVRLGGDEYAFLVPGVAGEEEALRIGSALLARLDEPFQVGGIEIGVGGALGVALAPRHGTEPGALLQHADIAMYASKDQREGGARLFAPELASSGTRRLSLAAELRTALAEGELMVHYQPVAEIQSGEVVGTEALLRWRHPDHGWVSPDEVIPLAEHLGIMRPLTLFVLETAVRQCLSWRQLGYDLHVAVNLSAQSLVDLNLVADIEGVLTTVGLDPAHLILEITETQVIRDPERTREVLANISAAGVALAVDDFGTGYSSLAYLTSLPVDEIKIDKSFVQNMLIDETSAKVVRSVVELSRNLGRTALAEGVEDLVTWDALAELGCELIQGYYLSRPVAADRLTPWLDQRARRLRGREPLVPSLLD